MSDTNQLLLLLAAAQQHQQQSALQQQLAKIQKAAATTTSTSSGSSGSSSGATPKNGVPNVALAQQITQLAQFGALMAAQKQQQKQQTAAAGTSGTSGTSGATMAPEMLMMWQQAMQMQALQQMMLTSTTSTPSPAKNQMEEAIAKMVEMATKKKTTSGTSGTTSSEPNNQMMNTVMWQLVAQQMQQKQQQQQLQSQQKKAAEAVAKQKKQKEVQQKQQQQQEELVKFLMAQHQLNHQKKHQKQKQLHEEAVAMALKVAMGAAAEGGEENGKKTSTSSEAMLRLPLQLGWRRQTCVRTMTASGIRGDVSYFAPCGKKLGTYSEVVRYLAKNGITYISRDNFAFTTKMTIGEFIVPKISETDETRQEREFSVLSEDDVNKELQRLAVLKTIPKTSTSTPSEEDVAETSSSVATAAAAAATVTKTVEEPEEPLDPSELNDEFIVQEDVQLTTSSGGTDECKIRERETDDLLINDNRHLPEFSRITNQCLDSRGFADALMVHEFVQNFGHVLGIDLEKTPKLESLCGGLCGDADKSDSILRLTRQLLRLALEFPGMGNDKRFGQGGGEMGLDRENFSEVMRIFLVDKGKRGEELSKPLESSNFLALRGEEKAAILAFLCDELVCSRNVVTEIDRNLDEISRLRGEKWMREGKARALKAARSKKTAAEPQSDSEEPPTRPATPKTSPVPLVPPAARKFTPGLGQCEVLTEHEESMSHSQMDALIGELHTEAQLINQKIHSTGLKIRSFPFGTDRFHRNYWLLAHTDALVVESPATSARFNPACNVNEIASRDPPMMEKRVDHSLGVDDDVISIVEDLVDEVVLQRARADRKTRKRYRRVENAVKRGWWTIPNRESVESLRQALLGRGIRERALHRLLNKPWFINELKFGEIALEPVGPSTVDVDRIGRQGWSRLNSAVDRLQSHLNMSDVTKTSFSSEQKPVVVPTTMALAQIVRDDVDWKTLEEDDEEEDVTPSEVRRRIVDTAEMVDAKFWRPRFQPDEHGANELFDEWKQYVLEEAQTTSQLMVALQTLEGMVMWERSAREALCQICKSMDGDEMLVCDGCESGCHMECFRPRMQKVPDGDWFCQRCREEKSGKSLCMFCSKETGVLHKCQRCAYHMHQDCAQDDKKETIRPETFLCPHCQEMKQMRFVKRLMLRGESEERELEEEQHEEQQQQQAKVTVNGGALNGQAAPARGANLKRKMEPASAGGLPIAMNKELCILMLDELQGQSNAAPFLEPVNPKQVPGYKMIIAKPMDLGTIRTKNEKLAYETPEDFADDIELMFANCRQFNIDHSEIGRAGINLHKFFQKRWKQLKYNFTKRLRRLHRHS